MFEKILTNKKIVNIKRKKIYILGVGFKPFKKILGLKFNRILFDNMSIKNLRKGIALTKKQYEIGLQELEKNEF